MGILFVQFLAIIVGLNILCHILCFLAFYGNLDAKTGFDLEYASVNATTLGNRTDSVKLRNEAGDEAYMICDFKQWETLPQQSKRDHCN